MTEAVDVVAHWTDLGEPEMFGERSHYWGYQDDTAAYFNQEADVHNIYQLMASKRIHDFYERANLTRRVTGMARTGVPGIQRYGFAMWSGDISCYLPNLGNHYGAQKHLIMGGIDFYGSDTGGFHRNGCYERGIDQDQSYSRWLRSSSWMDIPLRPHANQNPAGREDEPTIQTNPAFVGDVLSNKFNIAQRYALVPFYYSLGHRAHTEGLAVHQPMFLAFQDDQNVWSMGNQFMLGDALLIALDTKYGTQSMDVYLPKGTWYDYHTNEQIVSTGQRVQRPLVQTIGGNVIQTTPVFARSGAIVPKAFVDDQTLNVHGERKDGSRVNTFIARVWPSEQETSFEVVDDDGATPAYLSGGKSTTVVRQVQTKTGIAVTISATSGPFMATKARQYAIEVVLPEGVRITSVAVNRQPLKIRDAGFPNPSKDLDGYAVSENQRIVTAYSGLISPGKSKIFTFDF